jgi:uncharacterized protein YecE (DUF72 family)
VVTRPWATLKPQHRLEYYAQRFNTLELNITFYQLLSPGAVGGLINKVETGFHFILKAHRDLTHGTRKNAKDTMAQFAGTVDWFRQAQKLGGVLVQFPATFDCTSRNEDYLRWLVESLAQTHVIVEFRHARWLTDKTMDWLRELKAGIASSICRRYGICPSSDWNSRARWPHVDSYVRSSSSRTLGNSVSGLIGFSRNMTPFSITCSAKSAPSG